MAPSKKASNNSSSTAAPSAPAASSSSKSQPWGRRGTDFALLGRKDKNGKNYVTEDRPELAAAHIMRPVCNIKFKHAFTSHSGCHAVFIDIYDRAWLLGRNENYQLSWPLPEAFTTSHNGTDGSPSATPAAGFPFRLTDLPDSNAPAELKRQRIVSAACGRGNTVLVTDQGQAWTAGANMVGQSGHANIERLQSFTRVQGALAREKVVAASCGVNFTVFLTDDGKCYTVGSGEKGQLGNGRTGEHIAAARVLFTEQHDPLLVRGAIEGKKIVKVTSGQQHTVVLDEDGYAYAWGFGGLGRLGLGTQVDQLLPVVIPHFAQPNALARARDIAAGSTNTLFVDRQSNVFLCGKWKISGDGSAGQPWMTPKLVQDLQGFNWRRISGGGVTLFASSDDDDGVCVAWGQNATYGELSLGENAPRSATKPTRLEMFDHVSIVDVAAGQNSTFFIVRPPATQAEIDEWKQHKGEEEEAEAKSEAAEAAAPANGASTSSFGAFDWSAGWGFNDFASPAPATPEPEKKNSLTKGKDTSEDDDDEGPVPPSKTTEERWEEFDRYPVALNLSDACHACKRDDKDDDLLECEMCENAFHRTCLDPPLDSIPDGEWFCTECTNEDEEAAEEGSAGAPQGSKKRKAAADDDEDEANGGHGSKKAAAPKRGAAKSKRGRK